MQLETRTLAEQIADHLREAILTGHLAAGERLSQERIAEQFDVSRIPVRDALRELYAEGLLTRHSRLGVSVAEFSIADLEDLYDMRLALEPVLARIATSRIRPSDLDRMRDQLDRMGTAPEPSQAWFEANAAFHQTLNARAGRPRMLALVESLRAQTERYIRRYQTLPGSGRELGVGHVQIFEAVRQRDPEAVAAAVDEHMRRVRDRMLQHLGSEYRPVAAQEVVRHMTSDDTPPLDRGAD